MALFRAHALNRVHLHYSVQIFADGVSGVFVLAYLLRAGVPLPATLTTLAAILGGRFVIRPLVLPTAQRWGLRRALILGTLVTAASYALLPLVEGLGWPLTAYCAVSSLGSVFYWTCFHAYFAALGDAEDRGRQVGLREALATGLGIIAPLLGGWSLSVMGAGWTFILAAVLHALAAAPLIGGAEVVLPPRTPGAFAAARRGAWIFLADTPLASGFYVWQLALFVAVGERFDAYGVVMALAAIAGAVAGFLLGRHIDLGGGRRAVAIAYSTAAAVSVLRALSGGSPTLSVIATAAGSVSAALVMPVMMTAVYNLTKAAPCPVSFSTVTEGAWDLGCAATMLLTAGLVRIGAPLAATMVIGVPSAVAVAILLSRYYRDIERAAKRLGPRVREDDRS